MGEGISLTHATLHVKSCHFTTLPNHAIYSFSSKRREEKKRKDREIKIDLKRKGWKRKERK